MSFLFNNNNNNKNQHCKNANNVKSFTDIKQVIQQFSTLTSDELKYAIRKLPITDPNDRIALWKCFLLNNNTNNNNKNNKIDNSKNSNNRNHASGDTQTTTTTTTTMIDQQQQLLYHKLLINGQLSSFHQHNLDRIRKDIHRTFPHLDYFNPTTTTTTTTTTPTPTPTTTTMDANTTNDSTTTNNNNTNNHHHTNNHHTNNNNTTNNGQHLLKNILYAYSVFDGQVGYVQGMAFIAGYLLYHTRNEIDSFYMFIQLMNHKRYNTKDLFIHGLPLLKWLLSETNRVTLDLLPQSLSQMMHQECISAEMYASHFFLTLCTTRFPFDTVNRIWDLFLSESWPIIIRLIMGLFLYYEQELMDKIVNATSAEMITHLYHLCSTMDVYTLDHHVLQLFDSSDDDNNDGNDDDDSNENHAQQVLDQIDECMWLHYQNSSSSSSSSSTSGGGISTNRSHRSNSNSSSGSSHNSHHTNSSGGGGGGRNVQLALDSYQPFQLLSSSPSSSHTSNKLVAHFKRRFSLFFSSSSNNNISAEEENNHTTSSTTTTAAAATATTTIAHTATTATTTTAPIPINSHSAHTTTTVQQQEQSSSSLNNKKQPSSHASYIVSPPSTSSSYTDHVIENYLDNPSVATSSSYNLGADHHHSIMHNHYTQQEQQEQMMETAHHTNDDIQQQQEEEEEEDVDDDKHDDENNNEEIEDVNMNALLENDDHAREQCTKDESVKSTHDSIVANDVDSTDAVVTPAANNDHHHHTFSILVNGDSTVVFTLKNHNQHVQYKHKS